MTGGQRTQVLCALLCALGTLGWLGGERDRAAEGNRLYAAERYDEAETAYGEGVVDYPESAELRFNLATSQYRQGKFSEAITTLQGLLPELGDKGHASPAAKVSSMAAQAAYDIGNARFRLGQRLEEKLPQEALTLYERALAAYKRSMALDNEATDPKFNHEFVARHLEELKKRLEEEKKQEEQKKHEQPDGQQDEQKKDQPGNDQQRSDKQEQQAQQQQAREERGQKGKQDKPDKPESQKDRSDAGQQQAAGGEEGAAQANRAAAGENSDEFSKAEARTLIDAARGEEVDPSEVQRQLGIAGIGEAVEDW